MLMLFQTGFGVTKKWIPSLTVNEPCEELAVGPPNCDTQFARSYDSKDDIEA